MSEGARAATARVALPRDESTTAGYSSDTASVNLSSTVPVAASSDTPLSSSGHAYLRSAQTNLSSSDTSFSSSGHAYSRSAQTNLSTTKPSLPQALLSALVTQDITAAAMPFFLIAHEMGPAHVISRGDGLVTFRDTSPRASVHLLTIPLRFIRDIDHLSGETDARLVRAMIEQATLSVKLELQATGAIFQQSNLLVGFHKAFFISVPWLHLHAFYPKEQALSTGHYSANKFLPAAMVLDGLTALACSAEGLDGTPDITTDAAASAASAHGNSSNTYALSLADGYSGCGARASASAPSEPPTGRACVGGRDGVGRGAPVQSSPRETTVSCTSDPQTVASEVHHLGGSVSATAYNGGEGRASRPDHTKGPPSESSPGLRIPVPVPPPSGAVGAVAPTHTSNTETVPAEPAADPDPVPQLFTIAEERGEESIVLREDADEENEVLPAEAYSAQHGSASQLTATALAGMSAEEMQATLLPHLAARVSDLVPEAALASKVTGVLLGHDAGEILDVLGAGIISADASRLQLRRWVSTALSNIHKGARLAAADEGGGYTARAPISSDILPVSQMSKSPETEADYLPTREYFLRLDPSSRLGSLGEVFRPVVVDLIAPEKVEDVLKLLLSFDFEYLVTLLDSRDSLCRAIIHAEETLKALFASAAAPSLPDNISQSTAPGASTSAQQSSASSSVSRLLPLPHDLCPTFVQQPCFLCELSSPGSTVCVAQGDGFVWACNTIHEGARASCARIALDDSPCGCVWLGNSSPWGAASLRCYMSGENDVRRLGIANFRRTNDTCEGFAFLSRGRSRLVSTGRHRWSNWVALVGERQLLSALFTTIEEEAAARSRETVRLRVAEKGPQCLVSKAARLPRVQLRYTSAEHLAHFVPLVRRAALDSKRTHESSRVRGIKVQWNMNTDRKRVALFSLPPSILHRLRRQARLSIFQEGVEADSPVLWRAHAVVLKIGMGSVAASIEEADGTFDGKALISVCERWNAVPFVREQTALRLRNIDEHAIHPDLDHALLGGTPCRVSPCRVIDPTDLRAVCTAAGFSPDVWQFGIVRDAVTRSRLVLVQGPPGTGKSTTIGLIALVFSQRGLGQILVCAASNVAVDRVSRQCVAAGVEVLRLVAEDRDEGDTVPLKATLAYHVGRLNSPEATEFRELEEIRQSAGFLHRKTHGKRRDELRRKLEFEVIRGVAVVCCTCSMAGGERLRGLRFKQVVIDEATQSVESQTLIPLVRGAEFAVLVGDQCQLGPVVESRAAADAGLAVSLFERLVLSGYPVERLNRQYRMHPLISAFPNATFYEGSLQDGVDASQRVGISLPGGNGVVLWWHLAKGDSQVRSSYCNAHEADAVAEVIFFMASKGVAFADMGVVTPYDAQRALLLDRVQARAPDLQINSVDAFQGEERDYIIISTVRSNESKSIGFLRDRRRLNVALTRARRGLVIVGDVKTLSHCYEWRALALHLASPPYLSLLSGAAFDQLAPVDSAFVASLTPSQGASILEKGVGKPGGEGTSTGKNTDPVAASAPATVASAKATTVPTDKAVTRCNAVSETAILLSAASSAPTNTQLPKALRLIRGRLHDLISFYALSIPALRRLDPRLVAVHGSNSRTHTAATSFHDLGMPAIVIAEERDENGVLLDKAESTARRWFGNCNTVASNGCPSSSAVEVQSAAPLYSTDNRVRAQCVAKTRLPPQRRGATFEVAYSFDIIEYFEGPRLQDRLRESLSNLHGQYQGGGVPYCLSFRAAHAPVTLPRCCSLIPCFSFGLCSPDTLIFVTSSGCALQVDSLLHELCAETRLYCQDGSSDTSLTGTQQRSRADIAKALSLPVGQVVSISNARPAYPTLASSWVSSQLSDASFCRRFGMPRISYDDALADAPLRRWRARTLCEAAAGTNASLPVKRVIFAIGINDLSKDDGTATHVLLVKSRQSRMDVQAVLCGKQPPVALGQTLPECLLMPGAPFISHLKTKLQGFLTEVAAPTFVDSIADHHLYGSSLLFRVLCTPRARKQLSRFDASWLPFHDAATALSEQDFSLLQRAFVPADETAQGATVSAASKDMPAAFAYLGWGAVPRPDRAQAISADGKSVGHGRRTEADVLTSERIDTRSTRNIEWRPTSSGVLHRHVHSLEAAVKLSNATMLEGETLEEQGRAYLESCRKHFNKESSHYKELGKLDLAKDGDAPEFAQLQTTATAPPSPSLFEVPVLLVATKGGFLCRFRPDGEISLLSAVRAPLEGDAYREWATAARQKLASAKMTSIAAASASDTRGGSRGKGKAKGSRHGRGSGRASVPIVAMTQSLDDTLAKQSMPVAMRPSCTSWFGGRELEESVCKHLARLSSTPTFTATRYQTAVNEDGNALGSSAPVRQIVYSVHVLELSEDVDLSAAITNPREAERPFSSLWTERLLLQHPEKGHLFKQAVLPLHAMSEPLHVTGFPRSGAGHTTLYEVSATTLLDLLSPRQTRLASAVESALHSRGLYTAGSSVVASARADELSSTTSSFEERNRQLSSTLQQSPAKIAQKVDATLESVSIKEANALLVDETERHHLVCRVGRAIFGQIRDGEKTVESRLRAAAAALVIPGDAIGFVAEMGDPVLWMAVESVSHHPNHVSAVREHYGDRLWPGSSSMSDESLDNAFWELYQRQFTRAEWAAAFHDNPSADRVVCWTLGQPLANFRLSGEERSREFETRVRSSKLPVCAVATEEEKVLVSHLPDWRRFVRVFTARRRMAARCIQRHGRKHILRLSQKLLDKSIDEGAVRGSAPPLKPEVPREEPPAQQCS
ncbi:AAA domain-containing protein [bacterium]|nr:AAA domain-containing protein [bacterium]